MGFAGDGAAREIGQPWRPAWFFAITVTLRPCGSKGLWSGVMAAMAVAAVPTMARTKML